MRTDPLKPAEWERLRAALKPVLARKSFGTDTYRDEAAKRYADILDALWALGCHPYVLSDPKAHQFTIQEQPEGWVAQWKRPKTKNWCLMPITPELARRLTAYLALPTPSRKTIWQIVRECGREAGLGDVGPLTIRHTVAFRIFTQLGPSAAKESLQVGDRALQHYTSLSAGTRLKALRGLMPGDAKVEPMQKSKKEEKRHD